MPAATWISGRDMAQLMTLGIERLDLHFEVVYGISDNARARFDNANARRPGYRPQDRSEMYAEEILKRDGFPGTSAADTYRGGGHCMSEGGTRSQLAGVPAARPGEKRAKKGAAGLRPARARRR